MDKINFYDKSTIEAVKKTSIVGFLRSLGFDPITESGNELLYFSPLRKENTPSFFVNPAKNCFTDFGGSNEMKGDVVRLTQLMHSCSFLEAIERLLNLTIPGTASFSFSGNLSLEKQGSGIMVISSKSLQNQALILYVQNRGIAVDLARIYLKEVTYHSNGKLYYAVGFQNDLGGYELRSKYFQGSTSPKWYSTIKGKPNNELNLFEGFFDFLSCCQHHQVDCLGSSSLILNSLSLLPKALPSITRFSKVRTFLDNDPPGIKAVQKLISDGVQIENNSDTYKPYKDYNDFLTNTSGF